MNISGIRPIYGGYNYNEIKRIEVPEAVEAPVDAQQVEVAIPQERSPEVEKQQTFGAYDYASQYNPDATYSLKGAESDIHSLDVEKAISDMQKDEVIHQYQYFVGQELGANISRTPSVRGAEDFVL